MMMDRKRWREVYTSLVSITGFLLPLTLVAQDYTSTHFIVRDPVVTIEGGRSTSGSFQYFSSTGQTVVGENTSTTYKQRSGFLYFPIVSSPTVSATAGDTQVALSWTAASADLGWSVSGYQVGQSTVSGGSYSYTSVGNVTSSTRTSLTNGTAYYFVVRVLDAFGNVIATSAEVSSTPTGSSGGNSSGNNGGGGGGGGSAPPIPAQAGVTFTGRAYPLSNVVILKDGQIALKTIAGPDAKFETSLNGLTGGNYLFGVYGEDSLGRRSSLFTFPIFITQSAATKVGGIFLAPTIAVDKSEVKRGDNITILGQSAPQADVVISVNSEEELFAKTTSDKDGAYVYNFDTSPLEMGQHLAKSKASFAGEITSFGKVISFLVGAKSVAAIPTTAPTKSDLNNDNRVNLVDFSVAAYWYKRSEPPASVDLNGDGKITLVDFSIMAYYWTG